MKRPILITLVICLALAAAGTALYLVNPGIYDTLLSHAPKEDSSQQEPQSGKAEEGLKTNATIRFVETSEADPMLVGYWQNVENPNWYKAYYDDEDEDEAGVFWGKEWDETDGVMEEDLSWHGNGWYKWQRTTTGVVERYRMEINESEVPYIYKLKIKDNTMEVVDISRNKTYHFIRIR